MILLGTFRCRAAYGDGMITPRSRYWGAVEGLRWPPTGLPQIRSADLRGDRGGPVRSAKRRDGNHRKVFGPVMVVWFVTIAIPGHSRNLLNSAVLSALNPIHAVEFFRTTAGSDSGCWVRHAGGDWR